MPDVKTEPKGFVETRERELSRIDMNMRIWNLADETDPAHTKQVALGGFKFTSIDSYYQIKRATQFFGPMGQGWGYDSELTMIDQCSPPLAMITMRLWYIDPASMSYDGADRVYCPEIRASNKMADKEGRVDEECFKKATTDALTKSLSMLGFSADIFMGKFDGAKGEAYKAGVAKKLAEQRAGPEAKALPESLVAISKSLPAVPNLVKLEELFFSTFGNKEKKIERHKDLAGITPDQFQFMLLQFKRRKAELAPEETVDEDKEDRAGA